MNQGYGPQGHQGYGPPSQGYGPPPQGYYPQQPPPKKPASTFKILAIVMLCLFGGCAGLAVLSGVGAGIKQAERDKEPALHVTADELVEAYAGNEIAADAKYKDKKIEIEGVVESIDSDFTGDAAVRIKAKGTLLGVSVQGISKQQAAALKKGSKETFTCVGAGEVLGSPMLRECVVQ